MQTELVVIWDGAHQNAGLDLLCCAAWEPRAPEPESPAPHTPDSAVFHAEARDVLAVELQRGWRTVRALMTATGHAERTVMTALQNFTRARRVRSEVIPKAERTERGRWKRYRWVE